MSCWPAQPERGQGAFHNILPEAVWGGNLPRNLPALRGLMATQRKKKRKVRYDPPLTVPRTDASLFPAAPTSRLFFAAPVDRVVFPG